MDGESNKESKSLKYSIADLVVEDTDGNKYIVEIERAFTPNFMHKACFNSSRLIVDSISGNQDYTTINKIFHISLLYFYMKNMEKPMYHGQTIIHEIDIAHPVDMRIANQGLVTYEQHNIFTEYFFISVPLFNDVVNSEMTEWLYVMKHSDIREDFKSPYMKKVAERLSVLKMSTEERNAYFHYLKEAVQAQDTLTAAKLEGEQIGREKGKIEGEKIGREKGKLEGKLEESITIARNMLQKGLDINLIVEITGLSRVEVETL